MQAASLTIGILYEHPEWFVPLFAELDRRGLRWEAIPAAGLRYDPADLDAVRRYRLIVNRMSPSSYVRGHGHALFASLAYLRYAEAAGVPVVNGSRAYALELSKAAQVSLLARLGLPHPRTRVVNTAAQAAEAARDLSFPILVKPNIGGSGARIRRFDTPEALEAAAAGGALDLGVDQTALVQEYHPPAGGAIVRVEVLDGRYLYAIRVFPDPDAGFNLCPADICQPGDLPRQTSAASAPGPTSAAALPSSLDYCPADLPKTTLRVEGYTPPAHIVADILRLATAAGLDVGGIEYLTSERDGRTYVYDINVLSNFVSNAPAVVGFDPFPVLVDYLERRAGLVPAAAR